ncbi:MAG: hypothetical protein HGA75_12770 [Thiobacillus sp.]|nr:hypothetical protein [Thiobacillus sp.]
MAKTNYPFEKRQRDLAKRQKQEEKRRQKLADKAAGDGSGHELAQEASQVAPDGSDSGAVITPDDGATPEP